MLTVFSRNLGIMEMPSNSLEGPGYRVAPSQWRRGRGGKPRLAPDPTPSQRKTLLAMYEEGKTQTEIASAMGIPRSRARIWYRRFGLKTAQGRRGDAKWAVVNHTGYVVSRHFSESGAKAALYYLRKFPCRIIQIER